MLFLITLGVLSGGKCRNMRFQMTSIVLHILYPRRFQNRALACREETQRRVCVLEGLSVFFQSLLGL